MKTRRPATMDRDRSGVLAALKRAAAAARRLSIETGTPFYVWRNGRVIDLNASRDSRALRRRRRTIRGR